MPGIVRAEGIRPLSLPNLRHKVFFLAQFLLFSNYSPQEIFFSRSLEGEMQLSADRAPVRLPVSL